MDPRFYTSCYFIPIELYQDNTFFPASPFKNKQIVVNNFILITTSIMGIPHVRKNNNNKYRYPSYQTRGYVDFTTDNQYRYVPFGGEDFISGYLNLSLDDPYKEILKNIPWDKDILEYKKYLLLNHE